MRFDKTYVDNVLAENFDDAKRFFFEPLMEIHRAHLVMLAKVGIVSKEEARRLTQAIDAVTFDQVKPIVYDGSFEDLFCCVENLLTERCGEDSAGRLHTARSRNDIDVTAYRLRWREELRKVLWAAHDLRTTLIEVCARELDTVFPLYTHTQPAQPSTIAHYFLGAVEHLERDHRRLRQAWEAMNRCPLGSCAVTGTAFPIDRELVSRLLAFDGPTGNTYGSIAGVDYLLEAAAGLMIMLTTLGRLIQDLLLWSMAEFQFMRVDDGFVQPSSIMPQKRNPVALEHARALASKAFGEASAIFQMLHNTPFGDIVDVEDDIQPLVFNLFRDSLRPLKLLAGALRTARFDRDNLEAKAAQGGITLTELADTLVRREGISFRAAHAVAARMSAEFGPPSETSLSEALGRASESVTGRRIEYSEEELRRFLCPHNFVETRSLPGGPAPVETRRAVAQARERSASDRQWLEQLDARLREYPAQLKQTAATL